MSQLSIDRLLTVLRNGDREDRAQAARNLGELGDPRAVGPLISALTDEYWPLYEASTEALTKIGSRAVDELISKLSNPCALLRWRVAIVLGNIGDGRATQPLIPLLKDADGQVRRHAAEALKKLPVTEQTQGFRVAAAIAEGRFSEAVAEGPEAIPALVEFVNTNKSWEPCYKALKALQTLKWQPSTPSHRALLAITEGRMEDVVAEGSEAIEPLVLAFSAYSDEVRLKAKLALEGIGTASVPALVSALEHPDGIVRRLAASVLGRLGDLRAVAPLTKALSDPSKEVGVKVAMALARIKAKSGDPVGSKGFVHPVNSGVTYKARDNPADRRWTPSDGDVESFFERMSVDLIAVHGPLARVEHVSHFPTFEINFIYQDGTRIRSGERTSDYDIHFLRLGYIGQGPRYAEHFLNAAGVDWGAEEIANMQAGDALILTGPQPVLEKCRLLPTKSQPGLRREPLEPKPPARKPWWKFW